MATDRLPATDLLAAGGGYDIVAEPGNSYVGEAKPDQTAIALPIEGRTVRIIPRPPLVGDRTLGELLEHSPGYRAGMQAFKPNASAMAALRDAGPARVRVFFGSWCGVCKRVLPNLLDVNAALEGSNVAFDYYGLAPPPAGWDDPEVKGNEVTGLPMAIVFRDGANSAASSAPPSSPSPRRLCKPCSPGLSSPWVRRRPRRLPDPALGTRDEGRN